MDLLTFYSGILLPWVGGGLWLAYIESRLARDTRPNRFRQAGYGFFLGHAVLFLVIVVMNFSTGGVSWPWVMAFLLIFAGSGAIVCWNSGNNVHDVSPTSHPPYSTPVKILIAVLLVWMTIHLVFVTVEVFSQPLYPWDAWTVWVYRAKAWFFAGGIVDFVNGADWATATSANTYTISAWSYPLFPSVIPYWAALSLGRWSETLVNVPVLLAGIGLGLALYGQCREQGFSIPVALACCYLLYSIPFFGTHIALAGYADIWMAGFTGLGFIALLRGAGARKSGYNSSHQLALGLLMIALGVMVKNEGVVWLLVSLALLLVITCRASVLILAMGALTILISLAFALGITQVNLPLAGPVGLVDGQLVMPIVGKFALEIHNIWPAYLENFFTMGNWNLLWVLVAVSMLPSLHSARNSSGTSPGWGLRHSGRAFIGIFLATQFFIFGLTDKGLWADAFTAINRLPLHFVPALLFAVFVIAFSYTHEHVARPHGRG